MTIRSLACAVILAAGCTTNAFAHPTVSGGITIHDGPVSLGLNLSPFIAGWQHPHQHDAMCYRNFHRDHQHWGQQFYAPSRNRRSEHHHHDDLYDRNLYSRGHRPSHAGNPHRQVRNSSPHHHQHGRDCHLHYDRDHEHWQH